MSALPVVFYIVAAAAVLGNVLGVLIEKWLYAMLAPIPLIVVPMGTIVFLRPYLETNPILPEVWRNHLLELADPAIMLQMTVACAGGALVGGAMFRMARAGQSQSAGPRKSAPRSSVSVKKRVAAVTERTPLQSRTDRMAAAPRPAAHVEPQPVYDVAPALSGSVSASSVASNIRETADAGEANANRRDRGRRRAILAGFLMLDDGRSCPCRIVDLSDTGARVRLPTLMPLPDKLWLLNTSDWLAYEVELAWRADMDAGLHFLSKRNLRDPKTDRDRALHALCADLTAR